MKKILLSTVVLVAFSLSIILFQISCKKDAVAETSVSAYTLPIATTSKLGGVKPDGTTIKIDANGTISTAAGNGAVSQENKILFIKYGNTNADTQLWTASYDGTNASKINLTLPNGLAIGDDVKVSPDHKTLFITLVTQTGIIITHIYACNLDGTNLHPVLLNSGTIKDVY